MGIIFLKNFVFDNFHFKKSFFLFFFDKGQKFFRTEKSFKRNMTNVSVDFCVQHLNFMLAVFQFHHLAFFFSFFPSVKNLHFCLGIRNFMKSISYISEMTLGHALSQSWDGSLRFESPFFSLSKRRSWKACLNWTVIQSNVNY